MDPWLRHMDRGRVESLRDCANDLKAEPGRAHTTPTPFPLARVSHTVRKWPPSMSRRKKKWFGVHVALFLPHCRN